MKPFTTKDMLFHIWYRAFRTISDEEALNILLSNQHIYVTETFNEVSRIDNQNEYKFALQLRKRGNNYYFCKEVSNGFDSYESF